MNRYDLMYGKEDLIDLDKYTYEDARNTILEKAFTRNTSKFIFNSLVETYDIPYAQKITSLIDSKNIVVSNCEKFPFSDNVAHDGYLSLYKVLRKGYLRPNNRPNVNVIQYIIGDLTSCIIKLYREGCNSILLHDICFTLTLYYQRFLSTKLASYTTLSNSRERTDLFCVYLRNLLWSLSVDSKSGKSQCLSILLMDKVYFDNVKEKYTLDSGTEVYNIDYATYLKFVDIFVGTISALHYKSNMITPNLIVHSAVQDSEFLDTVKKCKAKNIEYIYYEETDVENILKNKLSETIIDYNKIYDLHDDSGTFKDKLMEIYIDAQTVNQTKRSLSTNYKGHTLSTKILNVPKEMYDIVRGVLDEQTHYLENTYYDNFSFIICRVD